MFCALNTRSCLHSRTNAGPSVVSWLLPTPFLQVWWPRICHSDSAAWVVHNLQPHSCMWLLLCASCFDYLWQQVWTRNSCILVLRTYTRPHTDICVHYIADLLKPIVSVILTDESVNGDCYGKWRHQWQSLSCRCPEASLEQTSNRTNCSAAFQFFVINLSFISVIILSVRLRALTV